MHRPLLFLFSLMVPFVASCGAVGPKDTPHEICFPTKKGTKWVYRRNGVEFAEVITGVEKKDDESILEIGMEANGVVTPFRKMSVSTDTVRLIRVSDGPPYDPPLVVFRRPIKAGDKWDATAKYGNVVFRESRTVIALEKVEVSAGTYDAVQMEVESILSIPQMGEHPRKAATWYVVGIGAVKMIAAELELELLSFTPGKD